jgi:hypothetical protein
MLRIMNQGTLENNESRNMLRIMNQGMEEYTTMMNQGTR